MVERSLRWAAAFRMTVVAGVCLMAVGCGTYEPDAAYPRGVYVAPPPPTAAEIAAQQQARAQAIGESPEIAIGVDENEYSDTDPSALTEFKPALEGHGTWVDDATYGTVWVPAKEEVGEDFQPYVTAGSWSYSDTTDYVWVSDYSWGWAPFHYGRWVTLPGHGWSWIPGRRYAGAWVTWRTGPVGYGYVGWAPAPPAWYWTGGMAYGWSFGFYDYNNYYVYCPHDHFYRHDFGGYIARGPAAREHYGRTQDYTPARPSAAGGGDRVAAQPTVGGGRVVASPTVSDRVVASPTVGRSVSGARGPRPGELGMKEESVLAPPASNQGLGRAQALASPSTAIAAGAAAPTTMRTTARIDQPSANNLPSSAFHASPATASLPPRSVQAQPDYGVRRTPVPSFASPSSVSRPSPSPQFAGQAPMHPSVNQVVNQPPVARSSPGFSSSPSIQSSPSIHSSPAPVARSSPSPSFTPSPSFRSSAPSAPVARSAPSVSSTPAFRRSTPAVRSTPSVSSSPSRSVGRSPSRSVRK